MTDTDETDPILLFKRWLEEAQASEPNDPTAMTLATADASGQPSARMVLLKDADSAGFVFYTNLESRKGDELRTNPKAALLFHWKSLRRQVRIEGRVEPVSGAEADAYYASRARGSQIGAWASDQSRPLESRFHLERRVAEVTARHLVGAIPRPPHWSGFRVVPSVLEFWQDKPFRLHDRLVYRRSVGGWTTTRLFP
jgi:pyridoxamine 5'-phosphate oxidase